MQIPYGGNSLPTKFKIDNAADIGIVIQLNFIASYSGMSIDK